jgi:hypothetical protein
LFNFPFVLDRGEDPVSGMPVLGFQHREQFIFDPYRSADLTFRVDPAQAYGLSREQADQLVQLNALLVRATRAALQAGSAVIQQELGLPASSTAEVQLTGEKTTRPVVQTLADYVLREVGSAVARKP